MPEPEMSGRQSQRRAGESVPSQGAGIARQDERINTVPAIHRLLCLDKTSVGGRGGWVVTACHIYVDVTEAAFCKMCFERSESFASRHVRNQPEVELCYRFMRQDSLAAGTGISAD